MTVQQKLSLPFADPIAVDVQLRIHAAGTGYDAYIQAGVSSRHPLEIGIAQGDIKDLNGELQAALQNLQSAFDAGHTDKKEQDQTLLTLSKMGRSAFNKIFRRGPARDLVRQALRKARTIQITSQEFLLPWEVLYDMPVSKRTDVQGFWGMRYNLSRFLPQHSRPGDFVSAAIHHKRPRIAMVTNKELHKVFLRELPAMRRLHKQKIIELDLLRALEPANSEDELETFGRFIGEDREIVHFACHAFDREPSSQSLLQVDDAFNISIENFSTYEFKVTSFPLVILNACRTGTTDPTKTTNWASQFWDCGARGVLATEFRVSDDFAADFIGELYKRMIVKKRRQDLGASLLSTRHYFWNRYSNPLGLAYALYASPDIRFVS